jgi:hypothetical protein
MADRYFVMGQMFIVNGTATVAEAGRIVADCTLNITDPGGGGNFTLYMANGTTGTLTDGTCDVSFAGYPNLAAGANVVTIAGSGTATLDITIGTTANTNSVNSWSATSGGACTASTPTSADPALFDANSFTAAGQTANIAATISCAGTNFTGATNTPTLAGSSTLTLTGSLVLIADMVVTYTGGIDFGNTGGNITTGGQVLASLLNFVSGRGNYWTFQDNCNIGTSQMQVHNASINTNGKTITLGNFYAGYDYVWADVALGASIINCTSWTMGPYATSGYCAFSKGTSSIRVTGTGAFTGATLSYYEVQLNGTAHTISGNNTFTNLIRTGTATKTDTLTLTAASTQIVSGTCNLNGNSSTNRILVQSSTLGTAATLHVATDVAANWTGTANVDFMDVTSTHAVDFSAAGLNIGGGAGNCLGNTGITFTTAAAQTFANGGVNNLYSTVGNWGAGRVPLPQDDVAIGTGDTVDIDMPRIGASVTYSGTPSTSITAANISNYGDYIMVDGISAYTTAKTHYFRNRSSPSVTIAGATSFTVVIGITTTYNVFTVIRTSANKALTITDGTTQTFANFICAVSGTRTLTIAKSSTGTAPIFAKSGGGTVELDYLVLNNNTASPVNTWYYGSNSTGLAGLTNWIAGIPAGWLTRLNHWPHNFKNAM